MSQPASTVQGKRPRVVVSLTTIPSRLPHVPRTILSLAQQTLRPDAVYLMLPHESSKEPRPYWPLTPELRNLEQRGLVSVVDCGADLGPITKLLPVLDVEREDTTLVVTIDDDNEYAPRMLESLYAGYCRHPGSRIGISGWIRGRGLQQFVLVINPAADVRVDVVEGWAGALYPLGRVRPLRPQLTDMSAQPEARWCDDVWISGVLNRDAGQAGFSVPLLGSSARGKAHQWTSARYIHALRLGYTSAGHNYSSLHKIAGNALGRWAMARRNLRVYQHFGSAFDARVPPSTPWTYLGAPHWCVSYVAVAVVSLVLLLAVLFTRVIRSAVRRPRDCD